MGNKVVVYSAEWCSPCKFLKSEVLPDLKADGWEIEIIDIETVEGAEAAQAEGVRGIPTCLVYKDGEKVQTFVGMTSKLKFDLIG